MNFLGSQLEYWLKKFLTELGGGQGLGDVMQKMLGREPGLPRILPLGSQLCAPPSALHTPSNAGARSEGLWNQLECPPLPPTDKD